MAPGLAGKDHRQRVDQKAVDPLLEMVADEEGDHDRADRPHQPVAQLDQMVEQRHSAGLEFGLAIILHRAHLWPRRRTIAGEADGRLARGEASAAPLWPGSADAGFQRLALGSPGLRRGRRADAFLGGGHGQQR